MIPAAIAARKRANGGNMRTAIASFLARRASRIQENGKLENGKLSIRQRGELSIIELVLLFVVAAAVLPTAVTTIFDVNTSGWGAAGTLWDLLPLFGVIAIVFLVIRKSGVGSSSAGL